MPNPPFPANATALPNSSRHDPLLEAIRTYQADLDAYNEPDKLDLSEDEMNRLAARTWVKSADVLYRWYRPAKTREGALAALHIAKYEREEHSDSVLVLPMIIAALAYFESEGEAQS